MKHMILVVMLTMALGVPARSQEQEQQQMVLSIGVSYGTFRPSSSATRSTYGSDWRGLTIGYFAPRMANEWTRAADFSIFSHSQVGEVNLYAVTFGVQRGFESLGILQPYLALRVGPCYGTAKVPSLGIDASTIGANANAAFGVIIGERLYLEARYDYFTRFAGSSFSGLNLSVGIRLFDIKLST